MFNTMRTLLCSYQSLKYIFSVLGTKYLRIQKRDKIKKRNHFYGERNVRGNKFDGEIKIRVQ